MSVCWGRRDRQAPTLDWHREAPGQGEPLPNPALSPENSTLGYARVQSPPAAAHGSFSHSTELKVTDCSASLRKWQGTR